MSAILKLAVDCPPDIQSVSSPSLRERYFRTGSNRTLTKCEYRSYYVFEKCEQYLHSRRMPMPELSHIDSRSAALLVMDYQVDVLTRFMTAAQSADAIACV